MGIPNERAPFLNEARSAKCNIFRQKTTVLPEVQLLDILKMVYEKYKGMGEGGKIFPVPKYSTILGSIKRISSCARRRHPCGPPPIVLRYRDGVLN